MSDDPYLYPGTVVFRNKLGIRDSEALDAMERQLVAQRLTETVPSGRFDLAHLRAVHKHLFQDIYDWAGEVRTVEISKGGQQFQFRRYIESGMADIHARLEKMNLLKGFHTDQFCHAAGQIMGDVNYVHPFREGNGRAQLQYLKQLAQQAGHPIDLTRLDPALWLEASRTAHDSDYKTMSETIARSLSGS